MKKWLVFTSKTEAQNIINQIDSAMNYESPETCSQIWEENVLLNKRYLLKLTNTCYDKLDSSDKENLLDTYPNDFVWITE